MHRPNINNTFKWPPKNSGWYKAIAKATKELQDSMDRSIDIYYSCAAIVLHKKYRFGSEKIKDIIKASHDSWLEVGDCNNISLVQLLDEETGIELANDYGESWEQFSYLNSKKWDGVIPNWGYLVKVRHKEATWTNATALSGILIAVNRNCNFTQGKLIKLLADIQEFKAEYENDVPKLLRTVKEETGIELVKNEKGLFFADELEAMKG